MIKYIKYIYSEPSESTCFHQTHLLPISIRRIVPPSRTTCPQVPGAYMNGRKCVRCVRACMLHVYVYTHADHGTRKQTDISPGPGAQTCGVAARGRVRSAVGNLRICSCQPAERHTDERTRSVGRTGPACTHMNHRAPGHSGRGRVSMRECLRVFACARNQPPTHKHNTHTHTHIIIKRTHTRRICGQRCERRWRRWEGSGGRCGG